MMDAPVLEEVLDVLRRKREIVRAHKFDIVGVFGSVARGEAGPESDVDIVIKAIVPEVSLFDMGWVWSELNEALGRDISLVELDPLPPRFRAAVERDLVPL
ncbi:nucleotidyltransferase family protein [Brevundimonas sp.]|jgi:hypothetical protein|uniref:nucleotidyltransferase family protein n=1 Tax=Brevundimonas sp. TaxID=1871086 RepID=UPI002E116668|nr:nucleotidyltransferase domain-containing protein [Brevundimonas sp.]